MTMTDGAESERAAAVAQARSVEAAVLRGARLLDEAAGLVLLRGQDDWLGPAREAFDARGLRLHNRLVAEERELRLLALAIQGSV